VATSHGCLAYFVTPFATTVAALSLAKRIASVSGQRQSASGLLPPTSVGSIGYRHRGTRPDGARERSNDPRRLPLNAGCGRAVEDPALAERDKPRPGTVGLGDTARE